MTFTAAELRQLKASDEAEERTGRRYLNRRARHASERPIICRTVRESIAAMPADMLAWCIANGYVRRVF